MGREKAGRQANGRSTIYQGKDGYWHGRVTVASDPTDIQIAATSCPGASQSWLTR